MMMDKGKRGAYREIKRQAQEKVECRITTKSCNF